MQTLPPRNNPRGTPRRGRDPPAEKSSKNGLRLLECRFLPQVELLPERLRGRELAGPARARSDGRRARRRRGVRSRSRRRAFGGRPRVAAAARYRRARNSWSPGSGVFSGPRRRRDAFDPSDPRRRRDASDPSDPRRRRDARSGRSAPRSAASPGPCRTTAPRPGRDTFEDHVRGWDHGEKFQPILTIRGERHSGTNWLRLLASKNCPSLPRRLSDRLDADGASARRSGTRARDAESIDAGLGPSSFAPAGTAGSTTSRRRTGTRGAAT